VSGAVEQTAAQDVSIDSSALPLIQVRLFRPITVRPVLAILVWFGRELDPTSEENLIRSNINLAAFQSQEIRYVRPVFYLRVTRYDQKS
jgi:hypothetical protein